MKILTFIMGCCIWLLIERNAVGLIQFTTIAVQQINIAHDLSVTKMQFALMDEVEPLEYVKLYLKDTLSISLTPHF